MTFCLHPQLATDTLHLGDFTICQVLLMNESQFPWIILVPRINDARELYELSNEQLRQIQSESISASRILMSHFNGDKLNTGALGNVVPQLHLHHIVRYENDAVWPSPVWGNITPAPYTQKTLNDLANKLRSIFLESKEHFVTTQI